MPNPDANAPHDPKPKTGQEQTDKENKKRKEHDDDQLDETLDESFPASDPPANY